MEDGVSVNGIISDAELVIFWDRLVVRLSRTLLVGPIVGSWIGSGYGDDCNASSGSIGTSVPSGFII